MIIYALGKLIPDAPLPSYDQASESDKAKSI
jgi:hypothetical protein